MSRHAATRLAICLLALPGLASVLRAAEVPPAADPPLIERTVIGYPRELGDYTLESAHFDKDDLASGVALRYAVRGQPLRLDVYVYPLGRSQPDPALADGMAEIEASIREVERRGTYRDVRFGDIVDFPVPWTDAPEPAPVPAAAAAVPGEGADDDPAGTTRILALVGDTGAPRRTIGRRRGVQLLHDGTPMQSLAYLFYRQLYLVKVRVSAPLAAGPQPAFEAAVDRAVVALVPALRIANSGGCEQVHIGVPSGGTDQQAQDAIARSLGESIARLKREGCEHEKQKLPPGYATQVLAFPADAWEAR